jgi:transcription initiation factor TFIIH subunit 1
VSDREHFKREISQIIGRNRDTAAATTAKQVASVGGTGATVSPASNAPSPAGNAAFNGLPSPAQVAANASAALAQAQANGSATPGAGTPGAAEAVPPDPTKDWQVRQRLLKTNPDLLNLHIELVRTGQISEEEFWEGREYLLLAEAVASSQQAGRNAQIVDPKPEQTETGDIKIKLSQQLIKDIFEQYPIVAKVYNDNVPDPLEEAEFWHRYFHSKLFDRHRTTGRSSLTAGAGGSIKDDAIFDKYLEDEDDDLEPKNLPKASDVYRLLDLAATEEDHGETGNAKDYTMRAGSQRKSLPLMRRFNEHSERLLTQAL